MPIISDFDLTWIDFIQILVIPVLLPALVGLATRWEPIGNWPTLGKRAALAALALLSQVLTELVKSATTGAEYNLWNALFLGVVAFFIAELGYRGLYKAPIKREEPLPEPVITDLIDGVATLEVQVSSPTTLASVIKGEK